MWTIAAANKKLNGPLGSYNGLTDVHLAHFYSSPAKLSHLRSSKLITAEGLIIPEQMVKVESLQSEKKKKLYDLLATSVIQNAAHKEGSWNKMLSNYLEDVSKMENVENIKVGKLERNLPITLLKKKLAWSPMYHYSHCDLIKSKESCRNISCFPKSAPSSTEFAIENPPLLYQGSATKLKRCYSAKDVSPYVAPLHLSSSYKKQAQNSLCQILNSCKKRKRKKAKLNVEQKSHSLQYRSHSSTSKLSTLYQNLNLKQCKITLLYHGRCPFNGLQNLREEIIIKQQHCGGTPVTVYKGEISPNETATFISLTHQGFTFSITIFLDGIRYLKLSSCCVFRYPISRRLGGSNGNFSLQNIEGGKPCLKCQYEIDFSNNNLNKKFLGAENIISEKEDLFKSVFITESKDIKEKSGLVKNGTLMHNSENITEKEDSEHSIKSEASISLNEEIEENLSEKFELHETETELQDQVDEEHNLQNTNLNSIGELNYDSESSSGVSIAESLHEDVQPEQFEKKLFYQKVLRKTKMENSM